MSSTTENMASPSPSGIVVTFYSFKGGVGRSMALANTAVLLARAGKRVLCIDWDLEAPGLDIYFQQTTSEATTFAATPQVPTSPKGLLHLLEGYAESSNSDWRSHVVTATLSRGEEIFLIRSGDNSPEYSAKLAGFSWERFFADQHGYDVLERLRNEWIGHYDYVLIDSRTGLTDSSGVCTVQMPDLLVTLFAANNQNTAWTQRVAFAARKARARLPYDRPFLKIIPILSRFDAREESLLAADALVRIVPLFSEFLEEWLPRGVTPMSMLEWTAIPYVPRYSFEESLAVETELTQGPQGLTFHYKLLADLLLSKLTNVRPLLALNGIPGADLPNLLPSRIQLRSDLRTDIACANTYLDLILNRVEDEPSEALDALDVLVQACLAVGNPMAANRMLDRCIEFLNRPEITKTEYLPWLWARRAEAAADLGDRGGALESFNQAMSIASGMGEPPQEHAIRRSFATYLAENSSAAAAANADSVHRQSMSLQDAKERRSPTQFEFVRGYEYVLSMGFSETLAPSLASTRELHRYLFENIPEFPAGELRSKQAFIFLPGSRYLWLCPPKDIQNAYEDLLVEMHTLIGQLSPVKIDGTINNDGVLRAVIVAHYHARLIKIHPFPDGNGRVARMLTYAQMLKLFPNQIPHLMNPVPEAVANREHYVTAVSRAHENLYYLAKYFAPSSMSLPFPIEPPYKIPNVIKPTPPRA